MLTFWRYASISNWTTESPFYMATAKRERKKCGYFHESEQKKCGKIVSSKSRLPGLELKIFKYVPINLPVQIAEQLYIYMFRDVCCTQISSTQHSLTSFASKVAETTSLYKQVEHLPAFWTKLTIPGHYGTVPTFLGFKTIVLCFNTHLEVLQAATFPKLCRRSKYSLWEIQWNVASYHEDRDYFPSSCHRNF